MQSTDHLAHKFPVSIKAVLINNGKVLLLKNERDEWELPGGKLEQGEDPEVCCARELEEETGLIISVKQVLNVWPYKIVETEVLIVSYGAVLKDADKSSIVVSHEHKEGKWFPLKALPEENTPQGYINDIKRWQNILLSA